MNAASFSETFPIQNSWLLIVSLTFAFYAIFFAARGKYNTAIVLLTVAAVFIRLFAVYADPFLHDWDEKYHALVARNMMSEPFKPMLRVNPHLSYTVGGWCNNHIWLHKQPLFLWQMGLSMKIFGVSEFAIRYPSAVMGTIMVPMIYRIALLGYKDQRIAFLSALMMCFSFFHLQQVSGYLGMDHNDISFCFYVLTSIWAYAEYVQSGKFRWALFVGLFAGCAILNKWLTGLLIFSGWGLHLLVNIQKKEFRKELLHFVGALFACTAVFLPWQIYIHRRFPVEAKYELEFNSRHIWEVVEKHGGGIDFYLNEFSNYFGLYICWLVPLGIIVTLLLKKYRNRLSLSFVCLFTVVFTFFSFIVKTKLPGYFLIVMPIGFVFLSASVISFVDKIGAMRSLLFASFAIVCGGLSLNLPKFTELHDPKLAEWQARAYNASIFKSLKNKLPPDTEAIANIKFNQEAEVMFYTDIAAYEWMDMDIVEEGHIRAAFFIDNGLTRSKYIGDPRVYTIPINLR